MRGNPQPVGIAAFINHFTVIFAPNEDGALLFDLSSLEVLAANSTGQRMLGFFTGSLVGVSLRSFDWFSQIQAKVKTLETSQILESYFVSRIEIRHALDPAITIDLTGNVYLVDGRLLCYLALRDVTKQRRIEDRINVYVKRLEWSNRELQDFAHIASHDLQEPLRAIQAFADRLGSRYREQLDDEGQEYVERLNESASRMRMLINDLLAYSRVTSKSRVLTSVSLNAVLSSVRDDLETQIKESGALLEIGDLPTVHANQALMRQLFQNIISNSIKYRKSETYPTIRVFAISRDSDIEAAPTLHNPTIDTVDVIVNDNGIGFDQKYAERIFGPFQRLHSQRRYQGTGIGLAICRKITEQCFGSISATSESGVGTSIHITLPTRAPLVVTE